MRLWSTILLLLVSFIPVAAQQFTLLKPPLSLRTPYAYPYSAPSLEELPNDLGLSNEGLILSVPKPTHDFQSLSPEDIARHASLAPLRDYLQANAVTGPRNMGYNGPERILTSGARLRLRQDQRWQLFSTKLKPKGDPFDQLPTNQPFENTYLACNQFSCQLLDETGKPVNWAKDYDLLQFTALGDLVYYKEGHLGLLSSEGEELVPAIASSIRIPKDIAANNYQLRYGDRQEISFLRGEDILNADLFRGSLMGGRYVWSLNNVFDTDKRKWLLPPGGEEFIKVINPDAGVMAIVENRPPPDLYPTTKDSLKKDDNVIHLVDISGKYLTSFWSKYSDFFYNPKEQYYRICSDIIWTEGKTYSDKFYKYYDLDFQEISNTTAPGKQKYFGTDSLYVVKEDWKTFLLDQAGDTLLRLVSEVRHYPIGKDTLLLTQRITWDDRPEGLEDASYIFSISRKEVIDTLPHLTRLSRTGDFKGIKVHLDPKLRAINNEQRLLNGLTEQSRRPVYPYSEKVCCRSRRYYDYAGNLIKDDFGNELFHSAKFVGDYAIILSPKKDCSTEIEYRVLRVAGHPDIKINPRWIQGYQIGRDDLLGFHYPEVCGGTSVMLKDGTVVLDSTSAFVGLYNDNQGILRLQFGGNYSNNEYLTFDGRPLVQGSINGIRPQADGAFIIKVGKLYGLVNRQGEILPPVFSRLYSQAGNIYVAFLPGSGQKYYLRGGKLLRSRF
jgi:hypothetical protein